MESLGGDQLWIDRFAAQHAAIIYYWILVILYVAAPKLAYNFSELIEAHAVDTYGEFADTNEEILKGLPPPIVAAKYYSSPDLYLFDEFQTSEEGVSYAWSKGMQGILYLACFSIVTLGSRSTSRLAGHARLLQ